MHMKGEHFSRKKSMCKAPNVGKSMMKSRKSKEGDE